MASLGMSCVKHLLFFFSLLFAVVGIGLLVIGALLLSVYHHYSSFVNENFIFVPIIIVVAGGIIFIIAFFGCCGIVKENLCMISTFASLLITIMIMEAVAGLALFVFRVDLSEIVTQKMLSTLPHYETDKSISRSWDILQTDMHCCGVDGSTDWKDKIPASCCQDIVLGEQCNAKDAYKIGCVERIHNFLDENYLMITIISALMALLQIIGAAGACCLARSLRKGYECV